MKRDQEHAPAPVAFTSELTPAAAPRPATSAALEQLIERTSARYIAELLTLSEELSQRVQATEHETVAASPSELVQQQASRPSQPANTSAGFPSLEPAVPHSGAAPIAHSAPAQQRQTNQIPAYVAPSQAQHQPLSILERLRLKGRDTRFFYWAVVLFVAWIVGALLGIGIVVMAQRGLLG